MKLGSFFDGSGGFPLAAYMCGIEPIWASEVEPYPIAVTTSRFPAMKHLGDITKVNGAEIEPVDIITLGSPCQSLSVAGKREGIRHETLGDDETTRSGLFMEAIRIIKEMRGATNGRYPAFAIFENVQGAFSSSKGEDFRIVLEEFIKIVHPTAEMPAPDKKGWAYADVIVGDGFSLAYRLVDAQYWGKSIRDRDNGTVRHMGTPQRRRRIYLVADFRGERAGEILFKQNRLPRYFTQGRTPWQGAAADAEGCIGVHDSERSIIAVATQQGGAEISTNGICPTVTAAAGMSGNNQPWVCMPNSERNCVGYDGYNGDLTGDISSTLGVNCGMSSGRNGVIVPCTLEPGIAAREGGHIYEGVSGTLRANAGDNQMAVAYGVDVYNQVLTGDKAKTLNSAAFDADHIPCTVYSINHQGGNVPMVMESKPVYCLQGNGIDLADTAGCNGKGWRENQSYTLNTLDRPAVVYAVDQGGGKSSCNVSENLSPTLTCTHGGEPAIALDRAFYNQRKNAQYDPQFYTDGTVPTLVAKGPGAVAYEEKPHYIVRRLTPTECARLQGFPDKWGHPDKKDYLTDGEYKFWQDVRNTDAQINGKAVKEYSRDQMLKWYNKLHSDSAEYKMWGNGIALPNALYVMQGIADALKSGDAE